MKQLTIICYLNKTKGWCTLGLYCIETKGFSETGGQNVEDVMRGLLQWPIQRNANYKFVTKKQFHKAVGQVIYE